MNQRRQSNGYRLIGCWHLSTPVIKVLSNTFWIVMIININIPRAFNGYFITVGSFSVSDIVSRPSSL
ncbi:Uncharacterised protein [Vibrio cholerae]|nr:Uncharacterised protein [Vibrio cholerae]